MGIGILRKPLRIVASSGWSQSWNFWLGSPDAPTADDLSSCSASLTLTPVNVAGASPLTLTSGAGQITISGGVLTVDASRTVLEAWATWAQADTPTDCDFSLRIIDPAKDVDRYVLRSDPASSRAKVFA
ncbi:MAG TPA: hypothetical protein VFB02_13940 [Bradyrhizobium sp.]|nr:hypothetical protein [Bradyrhizobium sp.]